MERSVLPFVSVVLTCFCITLVACSKAVQEYPSDLTWSDATLKLVSSTGQKDGGYAALPAGATRVPTLYSTYYTLKLKDVLPDSGGPFWDHQAATIEWLQRSLEAKLNPSTNPDPTVSELFYLVESLNMLGENIPQPQSRRITTYVKSLQHPSGPFAESLSQLEEWPVNDMPGDDALLSTYRSLKLLRVLKTEPTNSAELVAWLRSLWNDHHEIRAEAASQTSARTAGILNCLSVLDGARIKDLPGLNMHVSELKRMMFRQETLYPLALFDMDNLRMIHDSLNVEWEPPKWFLERMSLEQLPDGTFPAISGNGPDTQGTYIVATLFHLAKQSLPANSRLTTTISQHKATKGGFFPFSRRSSDLASTYAAITISKLLQSSVSADGIDIYVSRQTWNDPSSLFNIVMSREALGLPLPSSQLTEQAVINWIVGFSGLRNKDDLQNLYFSSRLARVLKIDVPESVKALLTTNASRLVDDHGAMSSLDSQRLMAIAFLVIALDDLEVELPNKDAAIHFLQTRQQNGGFSEEGQEHMVFTFLAVQALHRLQSRPTDLDGLMSWLANCIHEDGGFVSSPNAKANGEAPDLISTRQALEILRTLHPESELSSLINEMLMKTGHRAQ